MTSTPQTSQVRALVIGEALIDAVLDRSGTVTEHPGGSPANVALTLGRLEQHPTLLSWYGADERGSVISRWLNESGVSVAEANTNAPQTSVATARLQADGSATYEFDLTWDLAAHTDLLDATVLTDFDVVHTGSIAAVLSPGGDKVRAILEAARPHATITYDPNARPSLMGSPQETRPVIESYVALADVVKVSDEDVEWLYPDSDPYEIACNWQRTGPALVIVTRGGEGATAFSNEGRLDITAPRVTVADTVGAGDSFMGALIYGLGQHGLLGKNGRVRTTTISRTTLEAVLDQCVRVAAITVSRSGANPPRLAELNK
jgi:fructokinase